MKGKIFKESSSVTQDQARVLCDYYLDAAERIVTEEERIEAAAKALMEERTQLEEKISGLWVWFLTIILFFVYFIKKNNLEKQISDIDQRIAEYNKMYGEIFRDYRVSKLGVAYVPVAEQIKYNDRSFMVDLTGQLPDSDVTLEMSRQTDLLIQTIGEINRLSKEAPIVETSEQVETLETSDYSTSIQEVQMHDYLGSLERGLRTITYCMNDLDKASVSLPLVSDGSPYLTHIEEYATDQLPAGAPVIPIFDTQRFNQSIHKFTELNKLKDQLSNQTQQFDEVLRHLITSLANSIQAVSALKVASVDKVVNDSNRLLYTILKAPYNHYSPNLEYEEIDRIRQERFDFSESGQGYEPFNLHESSRVRLNPLTGQWMAEDGSVTSAPFGVHQIYEEIVAPVVQNLMQENRLKRIDVYSNIEDQKRYYLKEWKAEFDEFYRHHRGLSHDLINLMDGAIKEYVCSSLTLESFRKTERNMQLNEGNLDAAVVESEDEAQVAEAAATFDTSGAEFRKVKDDFTEFCDRLEEDVDVKARKFGHVEYYDAKLRDGYANEAAVASAEAATLDERRRGLAVANPHLAKHSELPPEPNIEQVAYEHFSLNLPSIARNTLEATANPKPKSESENA